MNRCTKEIFNKTPTERLRKVEYERIKTYKLRDINVTQNFKDKIKKSWKTQ